MRDSEHWNRALQAPLSSRSAMTGMQTLAAALALALLAYLGFALLKPESFQ